MGEVIILKRKKTPQPVTDQYDQAYDFLMECKATLEESDYKDLLCAIMDVDYYENVDKDMQSMADKYDEFFEE